MLSIYECYMTELHQAINAALWIVLNPSGNRTVTVNKAITSEMIRILARLGYSHLIVDVSNPDQDTITIVIGDK